MSDYVQSTNFATKDALPSGDPLKIVKGTEINTEFNNIATAVATKADKSGYTNNGVVYASSTGILSTGSAFVFDGTNVGVGESTPSSYGKFVVAGTGSFTNSLLSSSSTLTDKPTLEFRKTMNVTANNTNVIGLISFNGKWGTTQGEQAYISATSTNSGGIADTSILKLSVKNLQNPGSNERYIEVATSGINIEGGGNASIDVSGNTVNIYGNSASVSVSGSNVNITGNVVSPTLTGTPTTPTAALGTSTTQIASTAFVQSARNVYQIFGGSGDTASKSMSVSLAAGTWQLVITATFSISDPGSYDFTNTATAVANSTTATASVRLYRSGGSGFGRYIYGTSTSVQTLTISSPTTTTLDLGAVTLTGGAIESRMGVLTKIA